MCSSKADSPAPPRPRPGQPATISLPGTLTAGKYVARQESEMASTLKKQSSGKNKFEINEPRGDDHDDNNLVGTHDGSRGVLTAKEEVPRTADTADIGAVGDEVERQPVAVNQDTDNPDSDEVAQASKILLKLRMPSSVASDDAFVYPSTSIDDHRRQAQAGNVSDTRIQSKFEVEAAAGAGRPTKRVRSNVVGDYSAVTSSAAGSTVANANARGITDAHGAEVDDCAITRPASAPFVTISADTGLATLSVPSRISDNDNQGQQQRPRVSLQQNIIPNNLYQSLIDHDRCIDRARFDRLLSENLNHIEEHRRLVRENELMEKAHEAWLRRAGTLEDENRLLHGQIADLTGQLNEAKACEDVYKAKMARFDDIVAEYEQRLFAMSQVIQNERELARILEERLIAAEAHLR